MILTGTDLIRQPTTGHARATVTPVAKMRYLALLALATMAAPAHGRPTKSNRDPLQQGARHEKADEIFLPEKKMLKWGLGEAFMGLPPDRAATRGRSTEHSPRGRRAEKAHASPHGNKGPFSKSIALIMIIIFMLVIIAGMEPAGIGTRLQFDGNDQNFSSFELKLRIYLSANNCTSAYDLPNPNPIGATESEKQAAEKQWGLQTRAISRGGKRDEARTKASHARRAQDYKAGAILAAALADGDAEALTGNQDDDLRFSAMWPRVLDAY